MNRFVALIAVFAALVFVSFGLGQATCDKYCVLVNQWFATMDDAKNRVCLYVDTKTCVGDYLYAPDGKSVTCQPGTGERPSYTGKCELACDQNLAPQVTSALPIKNKSATGMNFSLRKCPDS